MGEGKRAIRFAKGEGEFPRRRKQNAQAIIELALILPLLLLLIVGALEFGRLFYTKIILTNAAREGAYYYSTHCSEANASDGTKTAAFEEAQDSGLSVSKEEVTIPNACDVGSPAKISVQTRLGNLILFGSFAGKTCPYVYPDPMPDTFTLCASVEMMVQ